MKKITIAVLAGLLSAGYVQASDQKNLTEVKTLVQEQTGYEVTSSSDIHKDIEGLLDRPLSEDAAVKIAFFNQFLVLTQKYC